MLKSVELFAGAGGLGLGLVQAGFAPRLVVERDRWCCDTLRLNHAKFVAQFATGATRVQGAAPADDYARVDEASFNDAPVDETHVMDRDIREIDLGHLEGKLDLVSGGPPCQPFSMGGRHNAHDDARDMFPQAVRAVRQAKPRAFVFENVKGLTRPAFRDYFEYIQLQLEHPELCAFEDERWGAHLDRLRQHHQSGTRDGLHYRVATRLLNAADYGVPQRRERVLFVGFRDDMNALWQSVPVQHSQEALVWDKLHGDYWERHGVEKSARRLEGRELQISMRVTRNERPDSLAWKTTRDAICDLPGPVEAHISGATTEHEYRANARIYPGHTGSYIDEPSKTLKAGVHGVPGGENMLRRADGSVRYFTVREGARIQTFPDEYSFRGAWSECMRQLGNAVPVRLARIVGESIASGLNGYAGTGTRRLGVIT